ncbi:hypothetical protein M0P65_06245 [Candidatus Gracilibacteria bacterium]|nr:hypothetical protein [Candidatus Gracilibacteria bacterium]
MSEYLQVEKKTVGLNEIKTGKSIADGLDVSAIMKSEQLNGKVQEIAKALSKKSETESGIAGRYFGIGEKGNPNVEKIANEYNGKIKVAVNQYIKGGQKDVNELINSLDQILDSARLAKGSGVVGVTLANLHNRNETLKAAMNEK